MYLANKRGSESSTSVTLSFKKSYKISFPPWLIVKVGKNSAIYTFHPHPQLRH